MKKAFGFAPRNYGLINMEDKIESFRRRYEKVKKGEGDVHAARHEALVLVENAKQRGDKKVLEDVQEMLMELELLIAGERSRILFRKSSHQ